MIKVNDDWTWICKQVDMEIESNEKLRGDVISEMQKSRTELDRWKELYQEGVQTGVENGEYLSFSEWFYEFVERDDWEF